MRLYSLIGLLCFAVVPVSALAQPVDALSARVEVKDAKRFVALFKESGGAPTADQLQNRYLSNPGVGLAVFLKDRITGPKELSDYVRANSAKYQRAIDVCLPVAEASNRDLRSIYLGLAGLLPEQPLPAIHLVFGQGNSGGTASNGVQVLGLEVICEISKTEQQLKDNLRHFFAHETVHTWQTITADQAFRDPLAYAILSEGVADYIAWIVTGEVPDARRDAWAQQNEEMLWRMFEQDRIRTLDLAEGKTWETVPQEFWDIRRRWVNNYGVAPEGWPSEVGYWLGRQIIDSFVQASEDQRTAINVAIALEDATALLRQSGYGAEFLE